MVSPRSVWPSLLTSSTVADFTIEMPEDWATGVDVDDGAEMMGEPWGGEPLAAAVLLTTPASTSARVMVCGVSAVQVSEAPGANVGSGQVMGPAIASVTKIDVNVTEPVLVTRYDHEMVSPRSVWPSLLTSSTEAD